MCVRNTKQGEILRALNQAGRCINKHHAASKQTGKELQAELSGGKKESLETSQSKKTEQGVVFKWLQ